MVTHGNSEVTVSKLRLDNVNNACELHVNLVLGDERVIMRSVVTAPENMAWIMTHDLIEDALDCDAGHIAATVLGTKLASFDCAFTRI